MGGGVFANEKKVNGQRVADPNSSKIIVFPRFFFVLYNKHIFKILLVKLICVETTLNSKLREPLL